MIRKIVLIVLAIVFSIDANAKKLENVVLRNQVSLNFPGVPEHKILSSGAVETYSYKKNGCIFRATIVDNIIEDYENYLLKSDSLKAKQANSTLEGIAKGKVLHNDQYLISLVPFKQRGDFYGVNLEYSTKSPVNPESKKRYSILLLIGNTLYVIECWYTDDKDHEKEKVMFLESVQVKNV